MKNNDTRNWILRALPEDQRARILSAAELVDLPRKRLLYDIDQPINDVYFIETGVSSILSLLQDGTAVETSTCGREGMVGLPVFLGAQTASTQAMQQIPGTAWRLPREVFLEEVQRSPALRDSLGRLTLATMTLIAQNSACNRRHSVEERCVRWLLTSHDQMDRQPFELTHQFLSQMLGVRRATVTVTAGGLQQAGLINYHRGMITITNREGLESLVCECYKIIRNEYARQVGLGEMTDDPIARLSPSDGMFSTVADGA
jgi:CRP-like cAMP-binding protein